MEQILSATLLLELFINYCSLHLRGIEGLDGDGGAAKLALLALSIVEAYSCHSSFF